MNSVSPASDLPQVDDLYDLVRLTLRLSRQFRQTLDEPFVQALGLNTKELLVLAAIMDGAQTPGRVAARQQLPAPTVTRIVTKLVAADLVQRVPDPGDLRRCELQLTDQGKAVRSQVRGMGQDIVQAHFGQLPPETVRSALHALRELQGALEARENA
ncbi:DNA-binding transcriptional regulator, MarR family [Deinococcus reticulitermitis]|uniref:DNA-binding transcriptional regulator, MarR family n=1 Tax=Deinococcus reticulitermitis TaxID=856736 RepID=A0A1H7BLF7_9DEIO|nr:MarR family winged helix-turn-helix transcriptional regulator [Deinococcus reticulitermitis]SEJ78429.1 DNA-binding transcriptional regulator, MarR family [Deinococcus reticulitermitis]